MEEPLYRDLLRLVAEKGYDLAKIEKTLQPSL
jgi:hypothetical protein